MSWRMVVDLRSQAMASLVCGFWKLSAPRRADMMNVVIELVFLPAHA